MPPAGNRGPAGLAELRCRARTMANLPAQASGSGAGHAFSRPSRWASRYSQPPASHDRTSARAPRPGSWRLARATISVHLSDGRPRGTTAAQNGGSARGYQGPFASFGRMAVFVTARRSVGQAVYLYIAVPRANILFLPKLINRLRWAYTAARRHAVVSGVDGRFCDAGSRLCWQALPSGSVRALLRVRPVRRVGGSVTH
jgi:hypothetical protein